jgi:ribosomal-protein-alanine N-acetyltransferase
MIGFLTRWFDRAPASIEAANMRDVPAFAQLHAASFHRGWSEHEFEQLLSDRQVLAHRLRKGNRKVGFILSRWGADEAEILSVAVASHQRGRGLSRDLLRAHLGALAAQGIRNVFLEVEETNAPARALYARFGFRDVGFRESYYKGREDARGRAVVMSRSLS